MDIGYALPFLDEASYKRISKQYDVICLSVSAVLCCELLVTTHPFKNTSKMHMSTIVVLACLVAVAYSYPHYPAVEALEIPDHAETYQDGVYDHSDLERSPRTKRGLLLLKKKLLLGAIGLKAAKVGAVGAGVAGAIALKSYHKPSSGYSYGYRSHGPHYNVAVHSSSWY